MFDDFIWLEMVLFSIQKVLKNCQWRQKIQASRHRQLQLVFSYFDDRQKTLMENKRNWKSLKEFTTPGNSLTSENFFMMAQLLFTVDSIHF